MKAKGSVDTQTRERSASGERVIATDVVVIGGGAIGLCAAHALSKRGRRVMVVDKGRIGSGASHGNAGLLVPSHVAPLAAPGVISQGLAWLFRPSSPFYIRPRLDRNLVRWLWQFWRSCTPAHVEASAPLLRDLSLDSAARYEELSDELAPFGFRRDGLLMLHQTSAGYQKNLKAARRAEALGLTVNVLEAAALYDLEPKLPPAIEGGVYYHQDGVINPSVFVEALHEHLANRGVEFYPEEAVVGFEKTGGRISAVRTSRQRVIQPQEVVLAAGAWSGRLGRMLGLHLPVEPGKGYSLTYKTEEGPHLPFILTEAKISVTPLAGRLRFGGTLELSGFDGQINERRLASIQQVAATYLGEEEETKRCQPESAGKAWMGYRPCTPDGLPLLGRPSGIKNLVVATGHAMIGMSLAPITGHLVADILDNTTGALDIRALHPDRLA